MESVDTERSDAEEGITAWRTRNAGLARTHYVHVYTCPIATPERQVPPAGARPWAF